VDAADGELGAQRHQNQTRSADAPAAARKDRTDLKAGFGTTRLEGFGLASRGRSLAGFGLSAFPFWWHGAFWELCTLNEKSGGFDTMRRSDGTSGKRGTSPDKGKGVVRSDVSLKRCPMSKLDQWMRWTRWTRREEDAKEAKLMRVRY
jgi:hypothetical protein